MALTSIIKVPWKYEKNIYMSISEKTQFSEYVSQIGTGEHHPYMTANYYYTHNKKLRYKITELIQYDNSMTLVKHKTRNMSCKVHFISHFTALQEITIGSCVSPPTPSCLVIWMSGEWQDRLLAVANNTNHNSIEWYPSEHKTTLAQRLQRWSNIV